MSMARPPTTLRLPRTPWGTEISSIPLIVSTLVTEVGDGWAHVAVTTSVVRKGESETPVEFTIEFYLEMSCE